MKRDERKIAVRCAVYTRVSPPTPVWSRTSTLSTRLLEKARCPDATAVTVDLEDDKLGGLKRIERTILVLGAKARQEPHRHEFRPPGRVAEAADRVANFMLETARPA